MAKPALKSREEMSADLKASGFDEGQTRGLIQAMTDAAASLDLLTRGEWKQQLDLDRKLNQERHQALLDRLAASEKLNRERHEREQRLNQEGHQGLLDRLAASEKLNRERHQALLDRLAASEKLNRERHEREQRLNQEGHQGLLDRLAASEKLNRERHQALLDRLAASEKMLLRQIAELRETDRSIFLWLRWGLGIFMTLLLFLVSALVSALV